MNNIKMHITYMDIAERLAQNSYSERKKVGAVLVKDRNIIGFGWNGTPAGFDNKCEDANGDTVPWLIHAEQNVYAKAAFAGISTKESILYTTLSPCYECAKLIIQAGSNTVIYKDEYRISESINLLIKSHVSVLKLDDLLKLNNY